MDALRILYNARCPICRAEIEHYQARARAQDLPLVFKDLHLADLDKWRLSPDAAKRRLHAMTPAGEVLSGIAAFAAIWDHLPRLRWLARAVRAPVIGPMVRLGYDHAAAPILYRLHLRRERLGKSRAAP